MCLKILVFVFRCIVSGLIWDKFTIRDKISFAESVFEDFSTDEISHGLSLLDGDEDLRDIVAFLKCFLN